MNFRHKFVWTGAGILLVALAQTGSIVWAQAPVLSASAVAAPNTPAAAVDADPNGVRLLVGRSTVLDVGTPIARVSLTSADVADALVTSPSQLLINGKMPGTISMFVWDRAGALRRYELTVQRDLALLSEQLKTLFPSENIAAHAQRQERGADRQRHQQGHHREGRQRRRRLRRQEGRSHDAPAARPGRGHQPGAAARAVRRGEPERDDRAGRGVCRQRRQGRPLLRPLDDAAVPGSRVG